MRNRLNPNKKIEFLQLMFLVYKDGAPMVTLGGILVDESLKNEILKSRLIERFVYLSKDENLFEIDIPKLTNREIQIILKSIPITEDEYEDKKVEFYGITYDEIRRFEKIYRYYPYYVESQFST